MAVETPGPEALAVVDAPDHLQPAVDALHGRAAGVQPLEPLGGARQARGATEIDLLLPADGQAVLPLAVAASLAGAIPPPMPCGATVLERAPLRFVADVRHGVPHRL